jgi:hypothetical protein
MQQPSKRAASPLAHACVRKPTASKDVTGGAQHPGTHGAHPANQRGRRGLRPGPHFRPPISPSLHPPISPPIKYSPPMGVRRGRPVSA